MHATQASWRSKTTRRSSGSPEISLLAILEIHRRKMGWENGSVLLFLDVMGILIAMNISRLSRLEIWCFCSLAFIKLIFDRKNKQHLSLFFWFCKDTLQQSDMIILFIWHIWHGITSFHHPLHQLYTHLLRWCLDVKTTWRTWPSMWSFQNHWSQSLRSGVRACTVAMANRKIIDHPIRIVRAEINNHLRDPDTLGYVSTWYDVIYNFKI